MSVIDRLKVTHSFPAEFIPASRSRVGSIWDANRQLLYILEQGPEMPNSCIVRAFYRLDLASGIWTKLADMPACLDVADASCVMPDDGRVCVLAVTDNTTNQRAGYVYKPHCDSWEVVPIEHPGIDEHDATRIHSVHAMHGLPGSRLALFLSPDYDRYQLRIFKLTPGSLLLQEAPMMPMPQGWEGSVLYNPCTACVAVPGNRLALFFRRLSLERELVSNFVTTYNLDAKSWSMVENVAGLDDVYGSSVIGSTIHVHAVEDVVFLGTERDTRMSMSMSRDASTTFAMQSNEGLAGPSWCAALRS